jgi:O-antigen/teichoic acid export membrane protein
VTHQTLAQRLPEVTAVIRQRGIGRLVARTASYNVAAMVAAGLGGVIVARVLGPVMRGEYAATTAWAGVALTLGQVGQPAAVCFFAAREPDQARGYVATSRAIVLITGTVVLIAGILLAPLLGRGNAGLTAAYRIAFATLIVAFPSSSYMFPLQARDLRAWNTVRMLQPALTLAVLVALWRLRLLTLDSALLAIAVGVLVQFGWGYARCRSAGLAPGRRQASLTRPLLRYGTAQIVALTPAVLNIYLDQLVLSLTVPAAALGRYSIAVTCTLLPLPAVSAIGNVAFPRLASRRTVDSLAHQMQWLGILVAACTAVAALIPLDLVAPWLIPHVFGPAYASVTALLWALTPAGILMACNQVTGDMLRGRKQPLVIARAEGLAVLFTVVLLFALLPVIGLYGAAIASGVAYGVALTIMLLSLRRLPPHDALPKRRQHGRQER